MKKAFKIIGFLILSAILAGVVLFFWLDDPKPKGKQGPKAEAMAQKMLQAVNKTAWDSTRYVQWSFRGAHEFFWDRQRNLVQVKWEDKEVLLNPNTITGKAFSGGTALNGEEAKSLVKNAWEYFCNDSFWLLAFTKVYDKGTERALVELDDGREGLMVSYTSGGVTPGDSYLWILDEEGKPSSWKMWVSIIPIGGLEFTWENWVKLPTGAMVAADHKSEKFEIPLTNLKAGQSLIDMDRKEDVFAGMN